jgi:hypothetical protein
MYRGGDMMPPSGTSSSSEKPQNSTIAPLTSPSELVRDIQRIQPLCGGAEFYDGRESTQRYADIAGYHQGTAGHQRQDRVSLGFSIAKTLVVTDFIDLTLVHFFEVDDSGDTVCYRDA